MALLTIKNVRIAGLAAAVPPPVSMNGSGIRRRAKEGQCQSDFCAEAAARVMAELGWSFGEIDAVVMATVTPDYPIPPTAIILQARLGVPKTAVAFDIVSRDLGFLHGLQVASSFLATGFLKKALLFAGSVSKTVDDSNMGKAMRMLPGDNGCVCALEYREGSPAMIFDSGGDGAGLDIFNLAVGGARRPPKADLYADEASMRTANDYIHDQKHVRDVAAIVLPESLRRVLNAGGRGEVDGCYFTAMDKEAEASLRASLGFGADQLQTYVGTYGDAASGSLPLAMVAAAASQLRSGPRTSLLGGIGPGLAWGSAIVSTDGIVCPDVMEI
jgi:3-oxoacyl-[acyl-carrier-protein] synthase-3